MVKKVFAVLAFVAALTLSLAANAQLIYGNTFPFWNVNGPLSVTGTSTLSGTTSVSGSFTASSTTNAIRGTTAGGNASAGYVGEVITATVVAGSAVSQTTATSANVTSISLTAGDWDVYGNCDYTLTGATTTVIVCGYGTTSAVLLGQAGGGGVGTDPLRTDMAIYTTTSGTMTEVIPPVRVNVSATTTLYMVSNVTFSAGTVAVYGTVWARRAR